MKCEGGDKNFPICQRPALPGPIVPDDQQPTIPPNDFCDYGWHYIPSSGLCYLYSHDKKSWGSSQEYCKGHGAHLASVNAPDAQNDIWKFSGTDPSALGM